MQLDKHVRLITRHEFEVHRIEWEIDNMELSTAENGEPHESLRFLSGNPNEGLTILLTCYRDYIHLRLKSYFKNKINIESNAWIEINCKEKVTPAYSQQGILKYGFELSWDYDNPVGTTTPKDIIVVMDVKVAKTSSVFCPLALPVVTDETLLEDFGKLLDNRELSDVKVIAGTGQHTKEFHLHKLVLAARSPVFAAMFKTDMVESRTNTVHLEDIEPGLMDHLVRYIYTGSTAGLEKLVEKMFSVADKYQLEGLKAHCERSLAIGLRVANAADVLQLAELHSLTNLKKYVISFICSNIKDVLRSQSWKNLGKANPQLLNELNSTILEKLAL